MDAIIQAIVSFIKMIRISDLVDIAIMSFLIYKLIWMTRKNSFGRVIKGACRFIKNEDGGIFEESRAMEMRCFWPPESLTPRSPT